MGGDRDTGSDTDRGRREILVFAPYARWTPHLETDLEISDDHLAAGDRVRWMVCDGDMEICDVNMTHRRRECLACVSRRGKGLALLPEAVEVLRYVDFLTADDHRAVAALSMEIDSAADLRQRMLGAFDVGLAALSSVISFYRDDGIVLGAHAEELRKFMRTSALVYLAMRNYLQAHPTDLVHLFNGRVAPIRGALRACQELGVTCCVHERGARLDQYLLTYGDMPHMIEKQVARIRAGWADAAVSREERVRIAEHWYQERARGRSADGFAFTDRQNLGELPPDFDPSRRNIAIFTSSEWEINAVTDEWLNPLYPTAIEGIREIIARVAASGQPVHLYVRIHPKREGAESNQVRELLAIDEPNVTVIGPHDSVCSYALMRACEKSVVTGSTMGIESTYWGKPSVLAGQAVWRTLGGAHVARDRDEAVALILDPDLPALDREGALMYAYDRATMGQSFRHFVPTDIYDGTYRGVVIEGPEQFLGRWPFGEGVRLAGATPHEINLGILGAKVRPLDERGIRLEVERLFPDGPAHSYGLMVGDVVVGLGREPVPAAAPYLDHLARALCDAEAGGDKVRLVVRRPGEAAPIVLRIRVPVIGRIMRHPAKPAARAHVLERAIRWLAARDEGVPDLPEADRPTATEALVHRGLDAVAQGARAERAFWKSHADALTLARAPDGSLQPAPAADPDAPADMHRGGERSTFLWAALLAGGTRELRTRMQHAGAGT